MKISSKLIRKQIAGWLVLLLLVPIEQAAAAAQQAVPAEESQAAPAQQQSTPATPDQSQNAGRAKGIKSPDGTPANSADSGTPDAGQQQNGAANPVGTAAAPLEKPTGVAASRPAGAVIAPAKQRRARSILIRVGILVGVGVAVGTVAALSHASPSRP